MATTALQSWQQKQQPPPPLCQTPAAASPLTHDCGAAITSHLFQRLISWHARGGREWASVLSKMEEGGGVRGCPMPNSHTVTVKTAITPEEQHFAGLCGLEWHSQRLAQVFHGSHGAPLHQMSSFWKLDSRHVGAALLSSQLLGVLSLLFFTCVNTDPASLS